MQIRRGNVKPSSSVYNVSLHVPKRGLFSKRHQSVSWGYNNPIALHALWSWDPAVSNINGMTAVEENLRKSSLLLKWSICMYKVRKCIKMCETDWAANNSWILESTWLWLLKHLCDFTSLKDVKQGFNSLWKDSEIRKQRICWYSACGAVKDVPSTVSISKLLNWWFWPRERPFIESWERWRQRLR